MEKALFFQSVDEVRIGRILRFIIPTYLTSLFNTVYTMVDGIFVSAYVGTDALAAINIVYPIVNILTGIALAFATGGSAIAAIHIGGNEKAKANQAFAVSMAFSVMTDCLIAVLIGFNLEQILQMLGASPVTVDYCKIYAFWWLIGTPAVIGKELFIYFIRVDGSPAYGFWVAVSGGVLNIILDYILIGRWEMGIRGAAIATILGLVLSTFMGIFYFVKKNRILHFGRYKLSVLPGLRCMLNGMSELVDQLAIAITTVVFNRTAMAFAGEDGIAAVSIIMYLQFLFIGIYFGFSMGIAPPLGYAYGNNKHEICKRLEKYAYCFLTGASIVIYALAFFLAPVCTLFFSDQSSNVYLMAVSGMRLYGLSFLLSGFNIFLAVRMMAYGKGYYSGMITFLRSFAFLLLFLKVLPGCWGIRGIWLAVPLAEFLTLLISVSYMIFMKKGNCLKAVFAVDNGAKV